MNPAPLAGQMPIVPPNMQQQQAPVSPQPAASRPAGQSVSVNALFDAAKKAEAAGTQEAPQGTRKVNVLSMFAAAAAADKAKDTKEVTSTGDSAASASSSGSASSNGGFAFHSTGTTNKKKGSAISAASKMKLLQMKKKGGK